jgi:hypothetical protein
MARFVRLRSVILNLESVAVVRPIGPDTVTVITTLGYSEHLEGEDAHDLLAYLLDEAINPVPTLAAEQLAYAWLRANAPDGAWDEHEGYGGNNDE